VSASGNGVGLVQVRTCSCDAVRWLRFWPWHSYK